MREHFDHNPMFLISLKNVVWAVRGGESYVIIQWEGRALRDIDRGKVHLLLQLYSISQPVSQLHSLCAGHTHTHTYTHNHTHTQILRNFTNKDDYIKVDYFRFLI